MSLAVQLEHEIAARIYAVRGRKGMLDADLAKIYRVTTSRLNEQYRRNRKRFPEDFAFQLSYLEFEDLMSQNAISRSRHGGRRKAPVVFSEHGAIMLASVLSSATAMEASVHVVRAFVYLRDAVGRNKQIEEKLTELENRVNSHDKSLQSLFEALRRMVQGPETDRERRQIGFHVKDSAEAGI